MAKKERWELKLTVGDGRSWREENGGSVDNLEGARAKARNLQERHAKRGKQTRVKLEHYVGVRNFYPEDVEVVDFLTDEELGRLDAQGAAEDAAAVKESLGLPLVEVKDVDEYYGDCNLCPWTDRERKRRIRQVGFRTGFGGNSYHTMRLCDGHYNALVAQLAAAKD
jgi:hypothetical protein